LYLYYRRGGTRHPLPAPEGGAEFLAEYDRVHTAYSTPESPWAKHTVGAAVTSYLGSADYQQLSKQTKRNYRTRLDDMRDRIGHVFIADIDIAWVEQARDRMQGDAHRWNAIRSRMKEVFARYRRLHPELLPINPWEEVRRLKAARSTQNRRWPDEVLQQVLHAATPEFRALLTTLLLTGQRVGDVVAFRAAQYDRERGTLGYVDLFDQEKTEKRMVLHVPKALAEVFEGMAGRHPERLLVSPRGRAWTVANAEETLLALRAQLGMGRYTLHGLRKTGLSAGKMLGFENRRLRALSGHDSDRNLEVYLDGLADFAMAREVQEALEQRFAGVLGTAGGEGANARRYTGTTGRAAAKAGIGGEGRQRKLSPGNGKAFEAT
jgi:integrase